MQLTMDAVGKYTHAQSGTQKNKFFGICLNVSGLLYSEAYFSNGKLRFLYEKTGKEAPPTLSLAVPGGRFTFEYSGNRENWIIFLHEPCPFYFDEKRNGLYFRSAVSDFPVPEQLSVSKEELPSLRRLFQEIQHKTDSGLPNDLADAEILVAGLLRRFLICSPDTADHEAAGRFKAKIDADESWQHSLDELAAETGYCRDHLRLLFVQKYGIPPGEYRIRQRLALIMRLIAGTELSMKEIAARAGLAHASYLNQLIRKYYHVTPMELCRRMR